MIVNTFPLNLFLLQMGSTSFQNKFLSSWISYSHLCSLPFLVPKMIHLCEWIILLTQNKFVQQQYKKKLFLINPHSHYMLSKYMNSNWLRQWINHHNMNWYYLVTSFFFAQHLLDACNMHLCICFYMELWFLHKCNCSLIITIKNDQCSDLWS